jgi:hypothetical protein
MDIVVDVWAGAWNKARAPQAALQQNSLSGEGEGRGEGVDAARVRR